MTLATNSHFACTDHDPSIKVKSLDDGDYLAPRSLVLESNLETRQARASYTL